MTAKLRAAALGLLLALAGSLPAAAQTSPGWTYGFVPTPAQWNAEFASKQDWLGSPPLLTGGGTMTGPLITAASIAAQAGFNVPPGVAPTTPNNGDIWTTAAGIFARINGVTVGPLSGPSAGSFAATSPITVSFPASVVTYAFDFTVANTWLALQTAQGATTTSPGWYAQLAGDTVPRVRVGLNPTDVPSVGFGPGNAARDAFLERVGAGSLRFGAPDAAAPVAQTLGVQNVAAGTANAAGANLTIKGSQGTGTGVGGGIIFQVAPAGGSGTAQNALQNILAISGAGTSITASALITQSVNANASSVITASNTLAGASSLAGFVATSDGGSSTFGQGSSTYATFPSLANKAFVYSQPALAGIELYADGAKPIDFYVNGSRAGGYTSAGALTLATALGVASGGTNCAVASLNCFNNITGFSTAGTTGTTSTNLVFSGAPTIAGGSITALTALAIRDTSAAFDVTLAAASSTALTAGRALTLDVVNAARTLKLGANLTIASDPGAVTGALKSNGTGTFAQAACADLSNANAGCSTLVGTSGATIPLLNGANTWSGVQSFNDGDMIVKGSGSGTLQLQAAAAAGTSVVRFPAGSTDFTATGAANNFVKQSSAGAALTVAAILAADLPVATSSAFGAVKPDNTTITISGGVITAVGAAASSVAVGTTTVTSGTNGSCLYNSGGTMQNHPCITQPQGRLTLTANTPVMTASASAQTTLRYDCANGQQVPYFDGTQDQLDVIASCEVTDAMVSAASAGQVVSGQVYDVWWVHGGANRICLAMSSAAGGGGGWASDTGGSNTARGTGYTQLDRVTRGYATNKNAIANCFNGATNYGSVAVNQATYLGTVYASANGQVSYTLGSTASGGGAGLYGVWNMYNRVTTSSIVVDNGAPYTYSGTTIRQARASAGNQTTVVFGLAEDSIRCDYAARVQSAAVLGAAMAWGCGLDSTTSYSFQNAGYQVSAAVATNAIATDAGAIVPQVGLHVVSANEVSDGANNNTFDGASTNALIITFRN